MSLSPVIEQVQTQEKAIAFTFDDGPHPEYTNSLLKLFEENDGKATFFVLASHVEQYPDLTKKLLEQGHEIGNHTLSHAKLAVDGRPGPKRLG